MPDIARVLNRDYQEQRRQLRHSTASGFKGDVYLMATMDEYCTGFNKGVGYTIAFVDLPFSIVSDLLFSPVDGVVYLCRKVGEE